MFPFQILPHINKSEKSLKRCRYNNCTAFIYYITLMAKCMCAWLHHSLKYITYHVAGVYRFKSARMVMLRLIYMFLGYDIPIQLVLSSEYDDYDTLEDCFIMYWLTSRTTKYATFYAWTNRLMHFSTCNLPITAASLC